MKIALFLFVVSTSWGQIEISVYDSETNSPVSNFFYEVSGRIFYMDGYTFCLDSAINVKIKHVSYVDTNFYAVKSDKVLLTPKVFISHVDVTSKKLLSTPHIEKINLRESKNSTLTTIDKLLEEVPSVQITDYGGGGAAKTLRIKGSSDRHNLILFDGVAVNTGQNAWSNLGNVPLANASEISLFTNGSSTAFGANALSGALNISFIPKFTNKIKATLTHSIQSFERNRKAFSDKLEPVQFLNLKENEVDGSETGLKLNIPLNLFDQATVSFGSNIEKSDNDYLFENGNYYKRTGNDHLRKNINIGLNTIKSNIQLGVVFLNGRNESGTPGTATDYTKPLIDKSARQVDETTFALSKLSYYYDRLNTFFLTSSYSSQLLLYKRTNSHENTSYTQKFEYHLTLNSFKHTSLIELKNSYLKSTSVNHPERKQYSYAALNEVLLLEEDAFDLYADISLRSDWYQDKFNSIEVNNSQSIQEYRLRLSSDNENLWVSFSKNYSIPTFNDLFWPEWGNPDLDVEYSNNWDLGWSVSYSANSLNLDLEVSYFQNSFDNLIRWIPSGSIWTPVNLERVKQKGFDTSFNLALLKEHDILDMLGAVNKISIKFSYLYNRNEEILNGDNTLRQLAYTPKHIYQLSTSFTLFGNFYIRYWLKKESEQLGVNGEKIFEERGTSNLFFHYKLNLDNVSLKPFFEIRNLANNYYDVRQGFPMPNRTFRLGLQLNY